MSEQYITQAIYHARTSFRAISSANACTVAVRFALKPPVECTCDDAMIRRQLSLVDTMSNTSTLCAHTNRATHENFLDAGAMHVAIQCDSVVREGRIKLIQCLALQTC